tara:strand:+ start:150 stop:626 length:477 start_codon:yes stop_codon:yes gene_type:complete
MKIFILFTFFLSINLFAHEDGGEKDIRCSLTYGTEEANRISRTASTLYTITIKPAISRTFLNNHVDIGVLPPTYCTPLGDDELCLPWETANIDLAPSVEFIVETKNGMQYPGKYAILNYQDPPRIKPHPANHLINKFYITKEQYDEAEIELNYCVLIY